MEITIAKKKPSLLLHICCAGCGAFVSQELREQYDLSLFFYNPNIHPESEYKKREVEVVEIARKYNIPLIIENYHHDKWLLDVKSLEQEPEKGKRCYKCYKYRMKKVAKKASEMKFDFFSTTLSVSPYKIYAYIKEIGDELARKYSLGFHDQDYKKKDGFKKASALSCKLNLYRQNYCGCEFSKNKK
jgi:predicted adenine nucleotide alpha hydrolase (AANH) superfamily ATPase